MGAKLQNSGKSCDSKTRKKKKEVAIVEEKTTYLESGGTADARKTDKDGR